MTTEPRATLALPDDQPSTITVTAHTPEGSSAHSAPMELVALRVQESTSLRAWWYVRTIHRERKPAAFYRIEIVTP